MNLFVVSNVETSLGLIHKTFSLSPNHFLHRSASYSYRTSPVWQFTTAIAFEPRGCLPLSIYIHASGFGAGVMCLPIIWLQPSYRWRCSQIPAGANGKVWSESKKTKLQMYMYFLAHAKKRVVRVKQVMQWNGKRWDNAKGTQIYEVVSSGRATLSNILNGPLWAYRIQRVGWDEIDGVIMIDMIRNGGVLVGWGRWPSHK